MKCPVCSGDLYYSIETKKMVCETCGYPGETGDLSGEAEGIQKETEEYDVRVFTCPECGGIIMTTGDEAAGFCSFCGASGMMDERPSREPAPKYILPFDVDKQRSISCLQFFASRAMFVPKEYKNEAFLANVRPLYIPYWSYDIVQRGRAGLEGLRIDEKRQKRERYYAEWNLDTEYPAVLLDASEVFDDELCRLIAPFDKWRMKKFDPAYLSGCNVAAANVDSQVYTESAKDAANERTFRCLSVSYKDGMKVKCKRPERQDLNYVFHTQCRKTEAALMPVWMFTWRKKDRVAYTVVNGDTGKTAGDLPVDFTRFRLYLSGAAAALFVLFAFLLPYIRLDILLACAAALSMVSLDIAQRTLTYLYRREMHADDKGVLSHMAGGIMPRAPERAPKMSIPPSLVSVATVLLSFLIRALMKDTHESMIMFEYCYRFAIVGYMAGSLYKIIRRWIILLQTLRNRLLTVLACMMAAALAGSFIVILLLPLSDVIFFGMMILLTGLDAALLSVLAGKLTRITTRAVPADLPQHFDKAFCNGMEMG